jgi:hypothetical protein
MKVKLQQFMFYEGFHFATLQCFFLSWIWFSPYIPPLRLFSLHLFLVLLCLASSIMLFVFLFGEMFQTECYWKVMVATRRISILQICKGLHSTEIGCFFILRIHRRHYAENCVFFRVYCSCLLLRLPLVILENCVSLNLGALSYVQMDPYH